jgi:chromate reductase, NAD(P)H dehydrogenase (quinone)
MKNAIDHASRPYGKSVWAAKPAGVMGVSVGSLGTAMAQQYRRNILDLFQVRYSRILKFRCSVAARNFRFAT